MGEAAQETLTTADQDLKAWNIGWAEDFAIRRLASAVLSGEAGDFGAGEAAYWAPIVQAFATYRLGQKTTELPPDEKTAVKSRFKDTTVG